MNAQPDRPSLRSALLRFLVPLAALAAMAAFASLEVDPAGAAESGYLALLATAVLLAVAALAPAPAVELGLGATLATAVVWALPQGPGRGAAMGLLLAATLAVAAGRALLGTQGRIGLPVTIPLALGVQFLLRGELLFQPQPDIRTLVALLVLPLAGAAAVTVLSERHGTLPLIAAAVAVAVAPGWDVASTLGMAVLAAGDVLGRREASPWMRAAAVLPFLVALAWEPGPGLAAAVCGLALWRPRIALGLAVPVAAALLWAPWGDEGTREGLRQLAWLPLLLPAVVLPARDRIENVATALLIAATVPLIPDRAVLAAPLGLAALSLRPAGPAAVPQRVWTAAVLGGTALLASYPWLREEPLAEALSLTGLAPGWTLAAGILIAYLVLAAAGLRIPSLASAGLAGAALLLALGTGLPPAGTPLLPPEMPVVLEAGKPAWETVLDPEKVESVVVESSLGNGAALAPGTPVAILHLQNPGGGSAWTLRAGDHTGEWAARRPDVARTRSRAPSPWVSWVAGDFFAQRYRSRWTLPRPERFARLRIERAPGLPPEVVLALHQLEVRE
ncbi:MAG TPA: hypothetical protein VLQ45_15680 [Thermoanaerobaculia bacterium]|nr:hypothetical protein [Thermoanaerobaculia bacterium]